MDDSPPQSHEFSQKVVKGVLWSGAQTLGSRLVTFAVFIVLSRLLSPEAFGLVAMASLLVSFAQIFLDQGFGDAIVQRIDLEQEDLDTAFWTNAGTGAALSLLGIALSPLAAAVFRQPSLAPIGAWLSLTFLFGGLSATQQAILRRRLAFKELAARSLGAAGLGGVIGITLALLGFGVWSLVAQDLATAFAGAVILWRISGWRPRVRFSRAKFRQLFSFGSNIVGINFLNFLNRHADDLLIGYYLGPTMLGFYTVAYRILVMLTDLLGTVSNAVALPTFSRLQNDYEKMHLVFYRAIHYTSLLAMPAFIGIALVAPEAITALSGSQWGPSIPVLRVLAFIGILHTNFYFHNSLVIALGKPSWRLGITLLNAVSNVVAFAIAVRWGIVAVAAAYVLRGYVLAPVEVWMVRKLARIDLRMYFRQFAGPVIGSLVMTAVVLGLRLLLDGRSEGLLALGLLTASGGAAFVLTIYILEPSLWPQLFRLVRLGFSARPVE